MIRCIAVDDEPLAIRQIAEYIEDTPFLELAGSFVSAMDALNFIALNPVDLMFVDIQMPGLNGLELVKSLKPGPQVIFITAYSEHAIDGFRLDALDYLLKPLDYTSFLKAATKAFIYFNQQSIANEKLSSDLNHIFIKSEHRTIRIELDKIRYIEGDRGYLKFFLENARPVMTLLSMKKIEERLPSRQFIRVHRSYIVNLDKIYIIERNQIIFDDIRITVSDPYKERFQNYINEALNP